jgi:hypothetical protein
MWQARDSNKGNGKGNSNAWAIATAKRLAGDIERKGVVG